MVLIFDLDQTLVNTHIAYNQRKIRDWGAVYNLIPQMSKYPYVDEIMQHILSRGIKCALVSSSPKTYCTRVINHFTLKFDTIVGYHDTTNRKPFPDPYLKAIELLQVNSTDIYAVGDDAIDINAAKKAGIKSIGCAWGSYDPVSLKDSKPDYYFQESIELLNFVKKY